MRNSCCCDCGPFRVNLIPSGVLKPLILSLLREKPMHGYEIIQEIVRRTGGFWRPGAGAIYPVLSELDRKGLVERRTESQGQRMRHIYSITEEGMQAIREMPKFIRDWDEGLSTLRNIFH